MGVRSLGWIELDEDTLTSENSSKAVSIFVVMDNKIISKYYKTLLNIFGLGSTGLHWAILVRTMRNWAVLSYSKR